MSTLLEGLDEAQREAVVTDARHFLAVAGPGSGKTRVLTRRVAYLVESAGVDPRNILVITFTNRAAGELKERLVHLLGDDVNRLWVGTFHSICARLLRRGAPHLGLPAGFSIADADDSKRVMKRVLRSSGLTGSEASKQVGEVLAKISRAKNDLRNPMNDRDKYLAGYAKLYTESLRSQNLLDFDDLLVQGVRMLGPGELGDAVRNRFKYVLVDEYQDTNIAQWELMRRLIGTGGSLFAVGDTTQAIYSFRGSTPEAMESFKADWPAATIHQLGRNWRSDGNIVAVGAALAVGSGVTNRAHIWTTTDPGDPVVLRGFETAEEEASSVVEDIQASDAPMSEKAILVRTHATTRLLEEALTAAGVPYVMAGGTRFWDRAEVRDAMSWVRFAVNPSDVVSFERAASVPRRGVGPAAVTAAVAAAASEGIPVGTWLSGDPSVIPRHGKALAQFADALGGIMSAASNGPAAAVDAVLAMEGFVDAACRSAGRSDTADDREANLEELRSATAQHEDRAVGPVAGFEVTKEFVENITLSSSADVEESGVCVSTAHAAKGREFDEVWIVGVESGLFPHQRVLDAAGVSEECRLLFVGATRARHKLQLSWASERTVNGETHSREPSEFLDLLSGLGDEVVQRDEPHTRRSGFGGTAPAGVTAALLAQGSRTGVSTHSI